MVHRVRSCGAAHVAFLHQDVARLAHDNATGIRVHGVSAARRAAEVQSRLAAIVESSDDAIIGATLEGVVTSWNCSAKQMFGYSFEEMIGQSIALVHPPERWELETVLSRVRRGEPVQNYQTVRIRKDGTSLDVFSLALLMFRLLPRGFSNRELRDHVAQLLARTPGEFRPGQMTYQLRRLRLKGLSTRIPKTHRYEVADDGLQAALFYTSSYSTIIHTNSAERPRLQQNVLESIRRTVRSTQNKTAA